MAKTHITLLVILSSVFFSAGAIAENKPLACQGDAAAGLIWENGKWEPRAFNTEKFILVQTKDGLTNESIAKALRFTHPEDVVCRNFVSVISCTNKTGMHLYFDSKNLTGGISRLLGNTGRDIASRDTLSVNAFSCTPF